MTLLTGFCNAQITGPVVVPFNLEKQTALLSVMARNFPRLSLGFGPVQTRVVSVLDDAAAQTTQVTLITVSNGGAEAFAEVQHGPRPCRACNMTFYCAMLSTETVARTIAHYSSPASWSPTSTSHAQRHAPQSLRCATPGYIPSLASI